MNEIENCTYATRFASSDRCATASRRRATRSAAIVASLVATIAAVPGVGAASTLISEVFYDAVGSDNGQSFVELFGDPGASLDGLALEGVNGADGGVGPSVALTGVFGPDGVFVLADDAGDGTTAVVDPDQIANFDFQNGPDSIVLRDSGGVLDAVGYGVFGVGEVFAGEGNPAPDAPAGSSLARLFADLDTDDNAADFEILSLPTPGAVEFLGVPEPAPAALVALGMLALARRSRSGTPKRLRMQRAG